MATTWTYDPTILPVSDKDQVRLLVGDTNSTYPLVQDEEITLALTMGGSVFDAAGLIARSLAARYARIPNVTVGGKSVSGASISERYTTLAEKWESQSGAAGVGIYAAGLTWSEWIADGQDIDLKKSPFDDISDRGAFFVPEEVWPW